MPKCLKGHDNAVGQKFCGECGQPVETDDASPAETTNRTDKPRPWFGRLPVLVLASAAIIAIVLTVLLVVSGGGGSKDQKVVGLFSLNGSENVLDPGASIGCFGTSGYDDIRSGLEVVVKDRAGKVLSTSELGKGRTSQDGSCVFSFTIKVPDDQAFYAFEVGHRGSITYSHDKLTKNGWTVSFSLG